MGRGMLQRRGSGARASAIVALSASALSLGACGQRSDATYLASQDWGAALAALACAKIFACCDGAESAFLGYSSEAQCRQVAAPIAQDALNKAVTGFDQVYDGRAARRCLDEAATASCAGFFPNGRPTASGPSCPEVLVGIGKLGDACEDLDVYCQTHYCGSGYCAVRPCSDVTCPAGDYCDPITNGCLPIKAAGIACSADAQCDPALGCHAGICGPPLSAGASCRTSADCAFGSCQPVAGASPAASICVAALADGAPCLLPSECASGACNYDATTSARFCGPPRCDGL